MPCKHYKEMMIYAQQAAEMDEPWKLWRFRRMGLRAWFYPYDHFVFQDDREYELVPKTIRIGQHEVPEPMRDKPYLGHVYYSVSGSNEDGVMECVWHDSKWDKFRLSKGLCHLIRDNCIAHAKALFSFSEVG